MGRQTKSQKARKQKPRQRAKSQGLPYGVRDVKVTDYVGDVRDEALRTMGMRPLGMTDQGKHMLAASRIQKVAELLKANPKPILEQLKDVGINPIAVRTPNAPNEYPDGVVLFLEEIQKADAEIASRGTLYSQIYGGKL
jgi:hypothetical protein